MNKSMKVWSKRRLKIRDSRRDIDAEVLEAMAQVHRGEGTVVFQGDDCPYPVGTRLPLSAHALMDIPITEDELKAHIMNDEVTRMYPHVIKPIALNKETVQNADCAVEQRTSSILVFEAEVGESEVSFVNRQAHLLGITVEEVQALSTKELSERLFDTLSSGHGAGWAEYHNHSPHITQPVTRADIAELINRRTVGSVEHAADDNYKVSGFPHNPTVITPKE